MVQSMDKERAMGIIKHEKSIEASFSFAYGFEVLEIYVNSYIFSYRRAILKTYRTDRH